MKVDVTRLSAEELTALAEESQKRLAEVEQAQEQLAGLEAELETALALRARVAEDIRRCRIEIARYRAIIKPPRRRKAAGVASEQPEAPIISGRRRKAKGGTDG
jgi:hypothetical protein